jgi:diguanylate cyclase (GGDEF)-like protein
MTPLLIAPALLFTMGAIIELLWFATRRQNPHLALIAAGFVLFAFAIAAQLAHIPSEIRANAVLSAVLYVAGAQCVALGIIARSRLKGGLLQLSMMSVLIIVGIWWYAYGDRSLVARIYVLNFGMALMLLYASYRTRAFIRGNIADRILFWSLLGVGLHFFPRTLLTMGALQDGMRAAEFGTTTFWIISLYAMGMLTIIMGIAIIIVTGLDVIASIKEERDTDSLTGVLNRRALDRVLKDAATLQQPVSVLVCDLDNFKRINDTYGHHGGDIVLQHFVQNLVTAVRHTHIVARLGGEEFVVIMPATPLHKAVEQAELIRQSNPAMGADTIAPGLSVECSIGVAELHPGESAWSAVRRADDLLYRAKKSGRNRVVSEDAVPQPTLADLSAL